MISDNKRKWRAIACMLIAVLMFCLMDAALKKLSAHYPPFQVTAIRAAASFPLVLIWALWTGGARTLFRVRWSLHLLRGAIGVMMMVAFVFALTAMPLSETYAIFFVAPLVITALAVPLLGERVDARRWSAVGMGLIGVLVVLRPNGEGIFSTAGLAVLLAAFGYAVSAILVRIIARTDSTQSLTVWVLFFMGAGSGLLAWPDWMPVQQTDWVIIVGMGVTGALAQYAVTEAFRLGEASLIAPLEYTALLWGVLLDATLWGVLPDSITWVGAGIIVASGIYLFRSERDPDATEVA